MSSQDQRCITISGMGVVSAAGCDISQALALMARGQRHVSKASWLESPLSGPFFEVADCPVTDDEMRTWALLEMALQQALDRAKLKDLSQRRVGIALGTTVACQLNDLDFYADYRASKVNDLAAVDRFFKGNLSQAVAAKLGVQGPQVTVVNACSSGADAIGIAMDWLRADLCDVALAGGADELNRVPISGFHALGISSDRPCTPFDRDRQGLNLGEGAAVLVLENQPPSSTPRLCLCGYGASSDAHHLTSPHPEGAGLARAIQIALDQAGITAKDIAFVNAHGTATRENDKVEGRVLLDRFPGVPVVSTKAYTGHTLGAAGAIEAVYSGAGLQAGWIPANIGFSQIDEEIGLVPTLETTTIFGAYALSTSLAFGGNNAALVLGLEGR